MALSSATESLQRKTCEEHGVPYCPSPPDLKLGISLNIKDGDIPINGLRHPPQGDTTGWSEELDAIAGQSGKVRRLQPDTANVYVHELADRYVVDQTRLRWWESLKVPARRLNYGDADGLSALAKLVDHQGDVILVVTDDEEPPWPVYLGNVESIIRMLRNSRFFEYILAAEDISWIVFDTHMNELVSAGQLGP